jgi:hypothetical protein
MMFELREYLEDLFSCLFRNREETVPFEDVIKELEEMDRL